MNSPKDEIKIQKELRFANSIGTYIFVKYFLDSVFQKKKSNSVLEIKQKNYGDRRIRINRPEAFLKWKDAWKLSHANFVLFRFPPC